MDRLLDGRAALAKLQCDVPAGFHPSYANAAEGTLRWADSFGLLDETMYQRLQRTDPARYSAMIHYDNYSPEALQLTTDFFTWLYLHDDLWIDGVARDPAALDSDNMRLIQILRGAPPRSPDHPLMHALADVRARLRDHSDDIASFDMRVEQYLTVKSWESRNHLSNVVPDERTYISLRAFGGGVYPCFEAAVITRPIRLTARVRNHAYVDALASIANNLVCWANDLASVEKELQEGCTSNLVMAMKHERGLNWARAVDVAVERWNGECVAFDRLAAQLEALAGFTGAEREALAAYIGLMRAWARASIDYHASVLRFVVAAREESDGDRIDLPFEFENISGTALLGNVIVSHFDNANYRKTTKESC